MNDDELKKIFNDTTHTPTNPEAKRRAIAAAMHEYALAQEANKVKINPPQHKGFISRLRLTATQHATSEKQTMKHRSWTYSSVAAASVLIFAGYLGLRTPMNNEQPTSMPASRIDNPLKSERETVYDSVEELAVAPQMESPQTQEHAISSKPAVMPRLAQSHRADYAVTSSTMGGVKMMPPPASDSGIEEVIATPTYDRNRFEMTDINPVKRVVEHPVSTFSIDVDTASYSFVRRKLNSGVLPSKDAVRVEEFLNYFDYAYPSPPTTSQPFATHVLVGDSPWKPGNKLIHIGIKGYDVVKKPRSNLVFLLDVSGSMSDTDKLPLVKQSLNLLLDQLHEEDTIAIVVYAGAAGTVLPPTKVKEKVKIIEALARLNAGGSTAGAQGIQLAYQLAEQHFNKEAVNRILLATDGDFNVGISEPEKLKAFVERKREQGIYLSVLGFGQGNYHDHMMQALAQNGNGIAAYIDTLSEAQKVLVTEATSSLMPIANDVKIQIEFNPQTVAEYRLIGYETRKLNREDFNNDKVDAGDIGSGHTVTAIYEITPTNSANKLIDDSRYQVPAKKDEATREEYALLKLRYKLPGSQESKLIESVIPAKSTWVEGQDWQRREYYFSAAVAGFGQLLKDDRYLESWSYDKVIDLALKHRGEDEYGYRNEFVQLVRKAKIAREM